MYETAKLLVDTAVKTHMEIHDVDRETAEHWIRDVMGGA
jgi:ketosteroid isomerase-like protein